MGVGNGSGSSTSKMFFLKIQGLKQESKEVFLEMTEKQGDKYVAIGNYKNVSGRLHKLEVKDFEYTPPGAKESKKGKSLKFYIVDDAEDTTYVLDIGFHDMLTSLLNSIASEELFEKIEISVYVNKKGFKTIGVKLDGNETKWKYDFKELNAMKTKVMDPDDDTKVLLTKRNKLDDFLIKEIINPLIERLNGNASKSEFLQGIPSTGEAGKKEEDDLPF